MASRWAFVIRDISNPCVVDFISSAEDAAGVVVPIPALPVEGKIFVWAKETPENKSTEDMTADTKPE